MIAYLDSSAVLRIIFRQPDSLSRWGGWERALTSELTRIEGFRSIDRLRLAQKLTDRQLADYVQDLEQTLGHIAEIRLEPPILQRAAQSFATSLGTLDALHLASALIWQEKNGEELCFITHDVQQGLGARAVGLKTDSF